MTISIPIGGLSRCAGGGHVQIQMSINGGAERTFHTTKQELALEDVSLQNLIIARLRSAVKEAGATTAVEIQLALEGKTFKV